MAAQPFPLQIDELVIPQQLPVRETTGERGKPDLDFDILNQIQSQTRIGIGTLQNRAQTQQDDLSTILQNVNVSTRDARKRKRDSDLMFTAQADELAVKSNQIRQSAMEAAADPFNDLKALFTDTPSMAEWAAQHNAVQNELSAIERRFASTTAGYNFDLNEAANSIQFAMQKLALTKGNIANISAANQAVITQIQAQSASFTQQLDTMLESDLRAELEDPKGQIPAFLVQRRLIAIEQAKAELADARAKAGKTQLEQTKALFEVITKFPELISEDAINQALLTDKPVFIPALEASITPQMAKTIRPKQLQKAQLDAKLLSDLTRTTLQGEQAFTQVVDILQRVAEPGTSVLGRDAQGNALGFNPDALPEDMKQDAAAIFDLQNQARTLQFTLAQEGVLSGKLRNQTRLVENELNRRTIELRDQIVKKAKADAQSGVTGKEAKAEAGRFAELGFVKGNVGAQQLLAQSAIGVIPGVISILSTSQGAGWGEGMIAFGSKFNEEIASFGNLFDAEGKLDKSALSVQTLKADEAKALASQNALGQVDANGNNKIQVAILSDWYEITLNRGIRQLEEQHAAEPETVAMLKSLRLGVVGLDPKITTLKDRQGKTLDTANVLFSSLAIEEQALQKAGTLPEGSDLTLELKGILLGDTIGNPEEGRSIYDLREIRSMTTPKTKESASLNWLIFRNKAFSSFRTGLENIIRKVPLSELDISQQITEKRKQLNVPLGIEGLREGPTEAEQRQTAQEIRDLRKQEGSRSLTSIMQQLLTQQEQ